MPWKTRKFTWLTYCNIHCTLVFWNWTRNSSEGCLYQFLSGKQVIVCSESFKDIKTSQSQSATKPDASQGGLPAWGRGLGKWQMLTKEGHNQQRCHHRVLSLQVLRCNNYILLHWWTLWHKNRWIFSFILFFKMKSLTHKNIYFVTKRQ